MRRNRCLTCFVHDCISFVSEEQVERCQNDLCAEGRRESGERSAVSLPPHSLHEATALSFIPWYLLTCSWVLETGLYWVPLLDVQLVNHVRLEDSHVGRGFPGSRCQMPGYHFPIVPRSWTHLTTLWPDMLRWRASISLTAILPGSYGAHSNALATSLRDLARSCALLLTTLPSDPVSLLGGAVGHQLCSVIGRRSSAGSFS